jgi:hypothetical protein
MKAELPGAGRLARAGFDGIGPPSRLDRPHGKFWRKDWGYRYDKAAISYAPICSSPESGKFNPAVRPDRPRSNIDCFTMSRLFFRFE